MKDPDRESLVEAASSAFRPKDPLGTIRFHPAWHDLDEQGRREAAEVARTQRRLEALLDAQGLSSTAQAVLQRIRLATGG
jgi:hypothetical protein